MKPPHKASYNQQINLTCLRHTGYLADRFTTTLSNPEGHRYGRKTN